MKIYQRVPGCNGFADLSLKIVFWTHKFAVGLIDMGGAQWLSGRLFNSRPRDRGF